MRATMPTSFSGPGVVLAAVRIAPPSGSSASPISRVPSASIDRARQEHRHGSSVERSDRLGANQLDAIAGTHLDVHDHGVRSRSPTVAGLSCPRSRRACGQRVGLARIGHAGGDQDDRGGRAQGSAHHLRTHQSNSASTKAVRVERQQVVGLLPHPDEADRDAEVLLDREHDAALGRRIELGEDDAGQARRPRGTPWPGRGRSGRWWRRGRRTSRPRRPAGACR